MQSEAAPPRTVELLVGAKPDEGYQAMTATQIVMLFSPAVWTLLGVAGFAASIVAFDAARHLGVFALAWACLAYPLPALLAVDIKVLRLPNVIVYPTAAAVALVTIFATAMGDLAVRDLLIGLACSAGIGVYYFALHLTGGMGLGDVKLAALAALVLGAESPMLAFLALVIGPPLAMIVPAAIMAARGAKTFAFGPGIALACLVCMAVPDRITGLL